MISSASGISGRARTTVSSPSRLRWVATAISRGCSPRGAIGPSALKKAESTPNGSTLMPDRGTPSPARSDTSSSLVAMTRSALRATARSSRSRAPVSVAACSARVEPSSAMWCRRSAARSEWNVCTTGILRSRVAARAASPPVQPMACTTSGRSSCHCAARASANVRMCGSTASSASGSASPAVTYWTAAPPGSSAVSGRSAPSLRAYTVTSCSWRASSLASAATRVSWVAGSSLVAWKRGVASSATSAIFMSS